MMQYLSEFGRVRFMNVKTGTMVVKKVSNTLAQRSGIDHDWQTLELWVTLDLHQTFGAIFLGHIEIQKKDIRRIFWLRLQVEKQFFAICNGCEFHSDGHFVYNFFKKVSVIAVIVCEQNMQ